MTFLKDVERDKKEIEHMTRKEFNDYLTDRGYDYPTKAKKTLNGWRYINVFGISSYLDPDKTFALVIYSPRNKMREEFFKSPEEALSVAPNDGLWQILNMVTGEVIYDIYNTNPEAKMESKVMNLTESYLLHLSEMEIRGENKPIENPDRRPNYIGMCMNEMPNDRMKIKCLRRVRELTVMNPFYQYRIDRFIDAINDRYEPSDKPGFTEFIRGTEDRLTEAEEIEPFKNVVSDLYKRYLEQCAKKFRKNSPDFYKCLRKKYNGKR